VRRDLKLTRFTNKQCSQFQFARKIQYQYQYSEYNTNHDRATAYRLLEELNDQRKRKWEKTVESTNFLHSSRKAWSLLRKLGTDSNTSASSPTHQITANDIHSEKKSCKIHQKNL
jgi:hypothetical protein